MCTVAECGGAHFALGLCNKHYQRMKNYGTTDDPRGTIESRFWAKVDKSGECWLWTASTDSHGYGQYRNRGAHRVAFEWEVGEVPQGMELDHLCHTLDEECLGRRCIHRRCVNPAHLEPVTPTENQLRSRVSFSGVNAAKTECVRGHEFTEENTRVVAGKRICQECKRRKSTPSDVDNVRNEQGEVMRNNLQKRAAGAGAKQAGALMLFERAAIELETAAEEHHAVATEATRIANEHLDIVNNATSSAKQSLTAASKIREFIGA